MVANSNGKRGKGVKNGPMVSAASLEDFEFDLTGLESESLPGGGVDLTQLPVLTGYVTKQAQAEVNMEVSNFPTRAISTTDAESEVFATEVLQPGLGRVVRIGVDWLIANPYQYRREITPESVADLVADFIRRGLSKALQSLPKVKQWRKRSIDPLTDHLSEQSVYVLSSGGHRRLTAWKLAFPGEPFPVYLEEGEASEEELVDGAIVENLLRRDPSEVEYATAFAALIDQFGYTQTQLAEKYGMGKAMVSRYLSLLDLPLSLQEENARGNLPVRLGAYLARYKEVPEAAEYLYQLYHQNKASMVELENRSKVLLAASSLSPEMKEAALLAAEPRRTEPILTQIQVIPVMNQVVASVPVSTPTIPLSELAVAKIENAVEPQTTTNNTVVLSVETEAWPQPSGTIPTVEVVTEPEPEPELGRAIEPEISLSIYATPAQSQAQIQRLERSDLDPTSVDPSFQLPFLPTEETEELEPAVVPSTSEEIAEVEEEEGMYVPLPEATTIIITSDIGATGSTFRQSQSFVGSIPPATPNNRARTDKVYYRDNGANSQFELEAEQWINALLEKKFGQGYSLSTWLPFGLGSNSTGTNKPNPSSSDRATLGSDFETMLLNWRIALVFACTSYTNEVQERKVAEIIGRIIRKYWPQIGQGASSAPRLVDLERPWYWVNNLSLELLVRLTIEVMVSRWQWEQREFLGGETDTALGWLVGQLKLLLNDKAAG
jgi:ParB family chromosome partitioning protein